MFGPMLHINFGNSQHRLSFGFEAAYWNYEHLPYSIDGGIEFEKSKIRIYSEGQIGIGVAGICAGPVLEINTSEKKIYLGPQASVWGNYFLGVDLRWRRIAKSVYFCPGVYFKVPGEIFAGKSGGSSHHTFNWDHHH